LQQNCEFSSVEKDSDQPHLVARDTPVGSIMYAILARWGFASKGDRQRLGKLLVRLRRRGYLAYDFHSVDTLADEAIESCSDLSPNVSLMSCITFSKRSQPPYVPLELGRITLSYLPKRTRILFRGHYTMLSAPPDEVSLVLRLQEGI